MAKLIQAVSRYGPRIDLLPTVGIDDIAASIAKRTGLNKSEVRMMIQEMNEVILQFNQDGRPVRFPDVGIFSPSVNREGEITVNFRVDRNLKAGLNERNFFRGEIKNSENVKAGNARLKELWDAEFPDDPLEIPAESPPV